MTIKLILGGPRGQMGKDAIKMINEVDSFELVACIDRKTDDEANSEIESLVGGSMKVYDNAETCFKEVEADVYVDLTIPNVGFKYTKEALLHNLFAVVGTSGFTDEQIRELENIAKSQKRGCIIAPNFALGSILMMLFSKMAAKYFPDVEIIEKHHDNKVDSPSGTAVKTVEMIQEERVKKQQGHPE